MAGQATPRKYPTSPNGAPTLTPLGHYAGRPDIALSRQVTIVGSKAGSRLHLASSSVSQSHALIVNCATGAYVRDLASRTHVYINGKDHREHDLSDGSLLQVGKFKFQFNAGLPGVGVAPGRDGNQPAGAALLNVEGGEMPLPIEGRTVLIGRRPTCDVPLIEDAVSIAHAIVFEMNGRRYIRDLSSRTGTFVNGSRINPQAELKFGDEIRIGQTTIGYASATGEVAERGGEVDEMDHLVSTAPLGTAALAPQRQAGHDSARGAAPPDVDDAIPMATDAPGHGEPPAPFVDAAPLPDQVHLDSDPDVAGPGDTAVLPAPAAEHTPQAPTLKAAPVNDIVEDLVESAGENVNEPVPPDVADLEAELGRAATPEQAAVVDDVLGLTPESRHREHAKAEDLGGSRRGWRGMTADEPRIPVADEAANPQPQLQPQPQSGSEAVPNPARAAEIAQDEDDAPLPVESHIEPTGLESPPSPVEVGNQSAPVIRAVAAETFDMEVEEPSPLGVDEAEEPAPPQLHLPPVVDDTPVIDEEMLLPLTPEEGGPIDLSIDESPIAIDEPAPALDLREPEPEREPEPQVQPQVQPQIQPQVQPPVEQAAAPPTPVEVPVPEPLAAEKPKPKRKRAPRKKKGAVEAVVAAPSEAQVAEPAPSATEPIVSAPVVAPEAEVVVEAPGDAVEVFDATQPTPESALSEDAVADLLAEPLAAEGAVDDSADALSVVDMTDSGFGRAVDSFVGESSGPLIEPRPDAPQLNAAPHAPQPAPENAQAETIDDLVADMLAADPQPPPFDVASADASGEAIDFAMNDADVEPLSMDETAPAEDEPLTAPRAEAPPLELGEIPEAGPAAPADELDPIPGAAGPADELDPILKAVSEVSLNAATVEPEPGSRIDAPPDHEPPPAPAALESPKPAQPAHPQAAPPGNWGANQEHFLGGMPLKLNKPVKPAGLADNSGAAAARQNAPPMPPPPPRAKRPNARTRSPFDVGPSDSAVEDQGASIPPFRGNSPKAGQVTTGFDGLAMPPVRQTDVFSQMSTPAAFANAFASDIEDDDIFSRGARLARQQQEKQEKPPAPPRPPTRSEEAQDVQADDPRVNEPPAGDPSADDPSANTPAAEQDEFASPADNVWTDDAARPDNGDETHAIGAGRSGRPLPQPPAFPSADDPASPRKRKRRWFGLRFLLVLMLLAGLGAAGGVYAFVKKQTNVVGTLRFDNFDSLKTIEQSNLLSEQKKRVADHALRNAARTRLAQSHPGVAPGFLADPIAYESVAERADWAPPPRKGAFAVTYGGRDESGDRQRVAALVAALYDANISHLGDAGTLRQTVATLTAAQAKSEQRVAGLKNQIEQLNVVALQMPERQQVEQLRAEVARLDEEYNDAGRRVRDISLDIERMRQAMPQTPQPAGTAQAPLVDPELAKMQDELTATTNKLAQTKSARVQEAEAAQVALDAALESFQKQIAAAQNLAGDNPELSAYVAAAQSLQTETRDLTDKLIRRQQEQQRRLAELKTSLAEKLDARRLDAWSKDSKLSKYGEELALVQRQYNAALGGGATKEAGDYKAQIGMLEQMIKARQSIIGDDQFYADTINQLQKLVDDQQRGLDADRKHTESQLERMQAAFTRAQPAVEKMPAAQKELAVSLEKQLADINAARKKYTVAADAVTTAGDDEMKQAEAAAAALAVKIDARRKELSARAEKVATAEQEQGRLVALKDREAELAAAQTAQAGARQAFDAAQKSLRTLATTESEARDAGEKRDGLQTERVAAQKELEAQLRQLELKRAESARAVEPVAPAEADVEMTVHDPRPTYALASVGAIVAVFTLLILFTATGAAGSPDEPAEAPLADLAPVIERTPPTPMPQPVDDHGAAESQSRVAV